MPADAAASSTSVTDLQRSVAELRAENARLRAELLEASQQHTATSDILETINSSSSDQTRVFETILNKAHALCGVAHGSLQLYDGERFRAVALHNATGDVGDRLRQGYKPGPYMPVRQLLEGAQFVHVRDLAEIDHPIARAAVKAGMGTTLYVALRRDDRLLGQIVAARDVVRDFSEKEIALLQSFAQQAAIAIANARLLGELRQRTDDLTESLEYQTATSELLEVISRSAANIQPVMDTILAAAARLCGTASGAVAIRRDSVVRVMAVMGVSAEVEAALRERNHTDQSTLTGRTLLAGRVIQVDDLAADADYGMPEIVRIAHMRTALGVPLLRDGEPIGAIVVSRNHVEPFSERQIALIRTFADQAVIAMENARLLFELRESLERLKAAQANLIQSEKMASLGQLTAGIAHEIKNPLNFVNNFAGLSSELLGELKQTIEALLAEPDDGKRAELQDTMELLNGNLAKILEHGRRADGIVKSMLAHSRGGTGDWQTSNINGLVEEALNLAYHGARAQDQSFNVTLNRDFDAALKPIDVVPQDVTRVFLNLFGNGFYAMRKREREGRDNAYWPALRVTTRDMGEAVEIRVRDNGTGLALEARDKLFQPFFTTKPTGEGTGLGLSISYDIVTQQHGGTIEVESEPGQFTEFAVRLPRVRRVAAGSQP